MQGMLSDEVLQKLVDSEAHVLDISRSPGLTHDSIHKCLQVGSARDCERTCIMQCSLCVRLRDFLGGVASAALTCMPDVSRMHLCRLFQI